MADGRVQLPGGETIPVAFVPRGADPAAIPPPVTTPPPSDVRSPEAQAAGGGSHLPGFGSDITSDDQPVDVAIADAVTSVTINGVEIQPEWQTGTIEKPIGVPLGKALRVGPVKPARITADGTLLVGEQPIPTGYAANITVRHSECDDDTVELELTYLVGGVAVDPAFSGIIQDIPHHECEAGCVCQLPDSTARVVDLVNRTRWSLRRFVLQRDRDETGVSGTGIVAEGVAFSDGRATLRWLGEYSSVVVWDTIDNLVAVHGHNGATRLRWIDAERTDATSARPHPDSPDFPAVGRVR